MGAFFNYEKPLRRILKIVYFKGKSKRILIGTLRIFEIAWQLPIDVLITPRSILLIWEISTPISFASCAWVKPLDFLTFFRFFPKAIKNSFSSKYSKA